MQVSGRPGKAVSAVPYEEPLIELICTPLLALPSFTVRGSAPSAEVTVAVNPEDMPVFEVHWSLSNWLLESQLPPTTRPSAFGFQVLGDGYM